MKQQYRPITGMRAFTSWQRREMRARMMVEYKGLCQICIQDGKSETDAKIDISVEREDRSFSFDHIIPLADGGQNVESNLWPTHIACNELKGSGKVAGRVRKNRHPRKTFSGAIYTSTSRGY